MKKKGISFLVLILVFSLFHFTPFVFANVESLYCDSYTGDLQNWDERNEPSPYLADEDTGFVHEAKTDGATEGYFGFTDPSGSGTINSVTLYIECYGDDTDEQIGIYVDCSDGSGWVNEGTITVDQLSYGWETLILSTRLDSWSDIQNAQIYFSYISVPAGDDVYVRRAYLYVDYTSLGNDYTRDVSQSLYWTGLGYRICTLNRDFSQGLTMISDSIRSWDTSRDLTQNLVLAGSVYRICDLIRGFTQGVSVVSNVERSWDALKSASQSLSFSSSSSRGWNLARIFSQPLSFASGSDRTCSLSRLASQALSFTSNIFTKLSKLFIRTLSLGISITSDTYRLWNLARDVSQQIMASFNTERLFTLLRVASQSIITTFNSDRTWTLTRIISQSISFTSNSYAELIAMITRTVTQGITFTVNSFRNWSLVRTVKQTLTTVFNSERIINLMRIVSQAITTSFNTERLCTFSRELNQGLSFLSNIFIKFTEYFPPPEHDQFYRTVTMSLSLAIESIRSWNLSRTFNQSISLITNVYAKLGQIFQRTVTLSISFISDALVYWSEGTTWKMLNILVKTLSGDPIENALANAWEIGGSMVFSKYTNSTGYIPPQNLTIGNYTILITKDKYLTNNTYFSLLQDKLVEIGLMSVEEAELIVNEFNFTYIAVVLLGIIFTVIYFLYDKHYQIGTLAFGAWFISAAMNQYLHPDLYPVSFFFAGLALMHVLLLMIDYAGARKVDFWE